MAGDTSDSALWFPVSDVLICERTMTIRGKTIPYYEIVNLDDKEKVGATRLK
jgi:hypothetical protein